MLVDTSSVQEKLLPNQKKFPPDTAIRWQGLVTFIICNTLQILKGHFICQKYGILEFDCSKGLFYYSVTQGCGK